MGVTFKDIDERIDNITSKYGVTLPEIINGLESSDLDTLLLNVLPTIKRKRKYLQSIVNAILIVIGIFVSLFANEMCDILKWLIVGASFIIAVINIFAECIIEPEDKFTSRQKEEIMENIAYFLKFRKCKCSVLIDKKKELTDVMNSLVQKQGEVEGLMKDTK